MGWLLFTSTQVLLTSVALGALKRTGVISVDPRKIDNPTLRSLFETAVDLGTEVSAKAEKLVATVREAK